MTICLLWEVTLFLREPKDIVRLRATERQEETRRSELKRQRRRGIIRSPREVEVRLAGHGDVGEVLLQDEDVPAHLLDARLADPLEVLGPVDEDAGDEVAQAWRRGGQASTRRSFPNSAHHSPPRARALTFEDVLELVLLQRGAHHLLDGRHVLVELDHQGVVVHALHVGHDGVVALFGQRDEVVEAVHPGWSKTGDQFRPRGARAA